MTPEPADCPRDDAVERYLDGSLDDEGMRAMETRIAHDEALRRVVQHQRRIDERLARLFDAPAPDAIAGRLVSSGGPTAIRSARRRASRSLVVAASLAIGAVALWRIWNFLGPLPENPYGVMKWRSMETVYHDVARAGFRPTATRRSSVQLARLMERRFDQPLSFPEPTDSVGPLGVGFCNTITEKTVCLIARVPANGSASASSTGKTGDVGVLVFVDQADVNAARALPHGSGLHVFERTVGRLALYEVSPLDRSHILNLLDVPDRARR